MSTFIYTTVIIFALLFSITAGQVTHPSFDEKTFFFFLPVCQGGVVTDVFFSFFFFSWLGDKSC